MAFLIFLAMQICSEGNIRSHCKAFAYLKFYLKLRLVIFKINFTIIFQAFDKTFDKSLGIRFQFELIFEIFKKVEINLFEPEIILTICKVHG